MKWLMRSIVILSGLFTFALGLLATAGAGMQVSEQRPRVTLAANKRIYTTADAIRMEINISNVSGANLVTHKGFKDQEFHLMITFTDPDGQLIQSKFIPVADEPGPPFLLQSEGVVFGAAAPVEIIQDGWKKNPPVVIDDVRIFYDLPKLGMYKAQVVAAFEKFSSYREASSPGVRIDPASYEPSDSHKNNNFIALLEEDSYPPETYEHHVLSNPVHFEIVSAAASQNDRSPIQVTVEMAAEGGSPSPSVTLSPLSGVTVKLFKVSDIPAGYKPLNEKSYPLIAADASIPVAREQQSPRG